jgi:hypothetical protein
MTSKTVQKVSEKNHKKTTDRGAVNRVPTCVIRKKSECTGGGVMELLR